MIEPAGANRGGPFMKSQNSVTARGYAVANCVHLLLKLAVSNRVCRAHNRKRNVQKRGMIGNNTISHDML